MKYSVRITREAEHQITVISDTIALDSPTNARRWRAGLMKRLRSLNRFAERHEIAFSTEEVGCDVRHTFFGTYRILYTIEKATVFIISVRHGARRPLTPDEVRRLPKSR